MINITLFCKTYIKLQLEYKNDTNFSLSLQQMDWSTLFIVSSQLWILKAAEIAIQPVLNPLVELIEMNDIYIKENYHKLNLELDISLIDKNLLEIEMIIDQGLEHLEINYLEEGKPPKGNVFDYGPYNISVELKEGSKTHLLFTKVIGKIKMQLASTLVSLKNIQYEF